MTNYIGSTNSNAFHSKGFLRNVKYTYRYYRVDQNILVIVIKFCKFTESRNDTKSHAEYKEHFKFIYSYSLAAPFITLLMSERQPSLPLIPYVLQHISALYSLCKMSLQLTNEPTPNPSEIPRDHYLKLSRLEKVVPRKWYHAIRPSRPNHLPGNTTSNLSRNSVWNYSVAASCCTDTMPSLWPCNCVWR
jgi:hypothetical protein